MKLLARWNGAALYVEEHGLYFVIDRAGSHHGYTLDIGLAVMFLKIAAH